MKPTTTVRRSVNNPFSKANPQRKLKTTSKTMQSNILDLYVSESEMLKSDSDSIDGEAAVVITSNNTMVTDVRLAKCEMMSLLKEIRDSQSSLCTKDDLQVHSHAIAKRFNEMDRRVTSNTSTISTVASRLNMIESSLEHSKHDNELAKQNIISRNLSIMGIPPIDDEDLVSLSLKLFSLVGCDITRGDVFGSYRVKNSNASTNIIIVKLNDFSIKHRILKSKQNSNLKLKDVIQSTSSNGDQSVYINNHVTPFFGRLLSEGRKLVKDDKIHSVWLSRDGCRLRFDAEGEERIYRSSKELHALISTRRDRSNDHKSVKQNKRSRVCVHQRSKGWIRQIQWWRGFYYFFLFHFIIISFFLRIFLFNFYVSCFE